MHASISCIELSYLSSLLLGVLLGAVLRGNGVCVRAYASLHVLILWFGMMRRYVRDIFYKRDMVPYASRNRLFLEETSATSVPRQVHGSTAPWGVVLITVAGGVLDACAVAITPSKGADGFILAFCAVALSSKQYVFFPAAALLYLMLTAPMPGLYGIFRVLAMLVASLLNHAYVSPQWVALRIAIGVIILSCVSYPCSSVSLPPVLLLSCALYRLHANPVVILTIAALVSA